MSLTACRPSIPPGRRQSPQREPPARLLQQHLSPRHAGLPNCVESNFTGRVLYILTREPEHIKAVLTGNFADFGKGQGFHEPWSPFLSDSIFTTDGRQWSDSRHLIRPMFVKDRISDLEIFERRTQVMMSLFGGPGEPFDIMDLFYRMTLDVTTEFLLGHGINSLKNPQAEFVKAFFGCAAHSDDVDRAAVSHTHPLFREAGTDLQTYPLACPSTRLLPWHQDSRRLCRAIRPPGPGAATRRT